MDGKLDVGCMYRNVAALAMKCGSYSAMEYYRGLCNLCSGSASVLTDQFLNCVSIQFGLYSYGVG